MASKPEIHLSTGTTFVETADVPTLIANALHPQPASDAVVITKLYKIARSDARQETQKWDGWPIDAADMATLNEIWGELPTFEFPMNYESWPRYLAAFNAKGASLDWELEAETISISVETAVRRGYAEQAHKEALARSIRAGKVVQLDPTAYIASTAYMDHGKISVEELSKYASGFAIAVRIVAGKPNYQKWKRFDTWTIVEAACLICDQEPLVVNDSFKPTDLSNDIAELYENIKRAVRTGKITQRGINSTKGQQPRGKMVFPADVVRWAAALIPPMPIPNELAELLSNEGDANDPVSRPDPLMPIYAKQEAERIAAGRYSLEQASQEIASGAGERAKSLQVKLMSAASSGALPVYAPGENVRYSYDDGKRVRWFYEEAHWDDLNAWITANEPRLAFRFPSPSSLPTYMPVDLIDGASVADIADNDSNSEPVPTDIPVKSLTNAQSLPPPPIRTSIIKHKMRTNTLDAPIRKAIAAAKSLKIADVWVQLRELALVGELPFTGIVEGDSLHYTKDDNTPDKITREAVRARLKNHTLPVGNGG